VTFNFQRLSKAKVPTGDSILVNQIIDIYRRAINAINPDLTNLATADWVALVGDLKGFEGFLRQLFDPLKAAILQGAVKQEAPLSRTVNATMRFDITDPRAIAYAEDRVGQLIKQVTEEVQQTVRDVVARAFREGRTVDQIAAELRNSIGLHDRWARAVENFERRQFEQLSKTMPYETAMKKAAELAEKYRARLIRKRAMTIARTETGQAAMYGRYLSWLQAADSGLIDPYTTGKRWFATRPCDRCKLLNGETVGMLETFSNGKMGPLDHPNCKCTMVLIPNWKPSLNPVSVQKAYQRKYATKREAAQAAANARWGNRSPKPSAAKEVNWTKLETIDEVNAAWNEKHGALVPGGFEGVSIRFARQAAAGLDAMFEQYPDVAAGLSFVGGTSSPLYRPTVQKKLGLSDAETTKLVGYLPNGCFGGTSMKYGFIVFSEDSDNFVQDAFSKNQYSGWVVPTRSNVKAGEYIAVHEFGHAVARHMGKQSSSDVRWQNDLQSVLDKGNNAAWKNVRPLVTKINEFGRETTGSKEISKALSEYGAADMDEAFAESWAEIHLSDSPRPYATTWVNGFAEGLGVPVPTSRIAKAYKRKFATREEAARFAANARWGGKKADDPGSTKTSAAEWTDLPTTDAIEEEWQRRFPNIKVDLVGIKPDVANEAAAAFVENAALFPEVAERIGVIQSAYISAAMSARQPVWDPVTKKYRSGRIRISSLYTKEKFDDAVKRGQESGLFVAGSYDPSRIVNGRPMTGVRSVMTHEFGHHVDYWLGSMTDGRSPSPAGAKDHDKFMQSTKLKIKKEFQKTLVPGAKADVKFAIGKTISRYATTNNRELFAESFAEFYTSANPRPAARTIVESAFANMGVPVPSSIQKAYKRKYATRREAAQAAARARWGNRAPKVDAISPVYSADFEPWQNQKGNPEIAAELRRRFPDLNVSFREANVAISNEVAATFVELADQYPEVAARIKNIGDELGMRDLEPAASGYPMKGALGDAANGSDQAASPWIRINAKYSTGGFDDIARTGAESGFKPKGVFNLDRTLNGRALTGVRSVMTHEFGHHVDYWLTDQFKKKYRLQGYEAELQRNALKDAGARAFGGPTKGLSEYASRNDRELFAEAFSEYHLSSSPRGLSRRIIEDAFISVGLPVPTAPATVIAKAYQRKYGSRSEAGRAAANARWGGRGAETGTAETAAVQIEPWVDQGSIKDINKAFNERWGERTILDLTGVDINAANGIADGLNELLTLYPDTELHFVGTEEVFKDAFSGRGVSLPPSLSAERKKELIELGQQFGVPPMGESVAGSYITTVQGIRINAKLITPDNAARFAVSSVQSEDNRFYTPTGLMGEGKLSTVIKETAKRTLVHEFAHAIDFTGSHPFGMVPVSKRIEGLSDPVSRAMAGTPITPESRKKFVGYYVGEYASTNSPELFAEVFTEYHLNPKPRKLSVDQAEHVMKRANKTLAQPSMSNGIEKAYQRKYGSRTEAARAAANARWGNRSGYSQGAVTSQRQTPINVETLNPDYRSEAAAKYVVDEVLTESVAPFDDALFVSAVENGKPVELVGVHATEDFASSFKFSDQPTGGGNLGTGTYASLIDSTGMANQRHYQERGRQLLVSVSLKNPIVIRKEDTRFGKFGGAEIAAITALEKKGLVTGKETRSEIMALVQRDMPPIQSADDFNPKMDLYSSYLSRTGYDGIVVIAQPSKEGFRAIGLGSQVSVFSGKQIKIIDPALTADERQLVYAVGAGETVTKAVSDAFDGRGFDLVSIEELENPSIAKAYKRKYGSRTEAARAAANARWGNKGYSQGAVTSKRNPPVETKVGVEGVYPDEGTRRTILDEVITESVEPFGIDAFVKAAGKGPVSLVGIHATDRTTPDLPFTGKPKGKGELGEGIYASLLTSSGVGDQQVRYQSRGRQALVRVDMKKPLVITDTDFEKNGQSGLTFSNRAEQAVFQHLRTSGVADDIVNDVFNQTVLNLRASGKTPVQYLKSEGYDGIVIASLLRPAMVSAFNTSQIKVIDPVLTSDERRLVYEAGYKVTKAVGNAFDGRDFDLVDIEDLISEPITKMSRSEAGRFAANVRWGNRTKAVPSIDAASLSRGQKITVEGKQLGNLTVNMVDTGLDGDLRNVSIPGYALFDGANMGLRREQMPQVPSRAKPQFLSEMRLKGVRVAAQSVDPRTLKPSQTDVSAALTGKVLKMMRDGSFHDSPAGRILVSKDGFVIDGHHRWAAASAYAFDVPGARLPIIRVDLNAADLISAAREFGAREGIKTLGFGETLKKAARWLFGS
jgi:hypothetical protein